MGDSQRPVQARDLTIKGDFVAGDQIKNYPAEGPRSIIPIKVSENGPWGWQPGADVTVGGRLYLLEQKYLGERSAADGCVVLRQARALQRETNPAAQRRSGGRGPRYAWLRQVQERGGSTPASQAAVRSLRGEGELLAGLRGVSGFPQAPTFTLAPDERTATLAVTWPTTRSGRSDRSAGRAWPTLDTVFEPGGAAMTPYRMFVLFGGLAGLCDTLGRLHERGHAHRCLTPSGILLGDKGTLALRDLGLAAHDHETGEGPPDYQAPEQRRRHERAPGAHTDVYQLAALVYHLLTGRLPAVRAPLPVGGQVPGLSARIGTALDAALAPDPAHRPDMRSLGAAFRRAGAELSRELPRT